MAPIYKFYLARFTEVFHKLSQKEQDELTAKIREALEQVGGKSIVSCVTMWSNEQWTTAGVEEYPDLDALQKHTLMLWNLKWYQYVESFSTLGVEMPPT